MRTGRGTWGIFQIFVAGGVKYHEFYHPPTWICKRFVSISVLRQSFGGRTIEYELSHLDKALFLHAVFTTRSTYYPGELGEREI